MGVVYEAFDHARGGRVALKTLRHLDARALVRFKNEFRALADLDHPNLVRLGELFGEDGRWFFSMELLEGQDFLSWVRGGGGVARGEAGEAGEGAGPDTLRDSWGASSTSPSTSRGWTSRGWTGRGSSAQFTPTPLVRAVIPPDPARLRAALAQLAAGVGALHAAGKVHRDIKPSNVMVTADGRVVLLDFGLVVQAGHGGRDSDTQVVGTAAYMAPEQAASRPVGPEADWYSVGAMLYEALTGMPPFTGKPLDVLMNKQRFEPPAPRQLWPDAPADLDQLAQELLRRDPGLRLPGADVLSRLGVSIGEDSSGPVVTPGTQSAPFVGRDAELGALRAAWSASRALESHAVTLFVRGESGIGKTALVRHFLEGLEEAPDDALVLAGRCYERESLPFKAFDGIVDALSRHLSRLDQAEVEPLLPHDAGLLARLFPVLRRVPALAQAALVRVPSPQELRTRAFSALRELLTRLAEKRAMALSIDDFQWADADSLALFNHLMHGPCPPPLLLVATVRSGAGAGEPSNTRVRPRAVTAPGVADDADIRELTLGALPPEEARGLAGLLSAGHRGLDAREIAVEAGGHPLFIHELVRHLSEASGHGAGSAPLEEALWARVERLDAPARRLLEVVAVAGEPLSPGVAAEAAQLERPAFARWVALLRAAHLVRAGGLRTEDTVECYHDRVRESVCAHLDAETQRRHHAAVAQALESSGLGAQDPQILVRHLEAAGETARAAELATRAARLASEALAFDRAAELLSTALRLGRPNEHEARRLRIELGDALVQAGRAVEAADAFLAAAEGADATTRLDCRRKAAEHLLATGQIERGRETLRVVLAEFDVELPATPRRALASLLWHRLRLRLRGYGFSPRDAGEVSPRVLALIDIYRAVAAGLGMVDTLQGADFQARGLLLALRTGEPARVARALGLEASFQATQGPRAHARARELIQRMRGLIGDKGDATLRAWADGSESIVRYLVGDLLVAVELSESAERIIREETTGMSWELNTVRIFRGLALRWAGLLGKLRRTCDDNVRDAARRGDRYAEATLRRVANIVWLARDNPDEAEVDLDRQPWRAPEGGYHMQNWYELRGRGEIDLYRSDPVDVAARTRDGFARLRRSMLPRVRSIAAEAAWLAGRLALAQAERTAAGRASELLAEAEHHATQVERVHMPYARVWADLLRAGVARRRGDGAGALQLLGTAITGAAVAQLYLCGAVAQRLHGQLEGGSVGAERFAEATRWMSGEGIHRPARMTAVVAPGFGAAPDEG